MLTKIQELVDVYYSMIGMDHHKHKDTYFAIQTVIMPFQEIRYEAYHAGYHNEIEPYGTGEQRATYEEAAKDLLDNLKQFITKELDFANRVLSEPAEWDAEDACQATAKIELLTAAGFDWLQIKGN